MGESLIIEMPEWLEHHSVSDIFSLTYTAIGTGQPPIVVINALGQGIAIWLPLLERLSLKHRLVVLGLRQTDREGHAVTFAEHCDDLQSVIQQEGFDNVHLLGWCTGAKLCARYCRTHPGMVQSMVFLSGSFKHPALPAGLDSAYERNLQVMLEAIVREPSLAERLLPIFANGPAGSARAATLDPDIERTPTGLPSHLEAELRRPFRDATSLAIYARQHVEFWSHDETATASVVAVPVLGISGEHDEIVSPAGFQAALTHFPLARYVEIPKAKHHFFYPHYELVADLINEFLQQRSPAPKPLPGPDNHAEDLSGKSHARYSN